MMLAKAKDIQPNFVGQNGHLYHLFQALVRTDPLMRVWVRSKFAKGMNADFHKSCPPFASFSAEIPTIICTHMISCLTNRRKKDYARCSAILCSNCLSMRRNKARSTSLMPA